MKYAVTAVAIFVLCGLLAALLLPDVRGGGGYPAKQLPIKVRVIDTDGDVPVPGATVTFVGGNGDVDLATARPPLENDTGNTESAVTDDKGWAELMGTFSARDNRRGRSFFHRKRAWYFLTSSWLKVTAADRPTAYVWLNGHHFGGERPYEFDEPLEVIVVMNKVPMQ
jgi:hypothetical protein